MIVGQAVREVKRAEGSHDGPWWLKEQGCEVWKRKGRGRERQRACSASAVVQPSQGKGRRRVLRLGCASGTSGHGGASTRGEGTLSEVGTSTHLTHITLLQLHLGSVQNER